MIQWKWFFFSLLILFCFPRLKVLHYISTRRTKQKLRVKHIAQRIMNYIQKHAYTHTHTHNPYAWRKKSNRLLLPSVVIDATDIVHVHICDPVCYDEWFLIVLYCWALLLVLLPHMCILYYMFLILVYCTREREAKEKVRNKNWLVYYGS